MSGDFVRVTRRPTPDELLARVSESVPGFGAAWPGSLFLEEDGSFTVHGVFSELSSYVRDHFPEFAQGTWTGLFQYVEQCVTTDVHSQDGVSNAACTCFLENIAGEGELSRLHDGILEGAVEGGRRVAVEAEDEAAVDGDAVGLNSRDGSPVFTQLAQLPIGM